MTRVPLCVDSSDGISFPGQRTAAPARWGCGSPTKALEAGNRGCGHCPHFGRRTGPYDCRTGPDWRCFRGSGEYSTAGTRFESHLGHVFSLFRGFLVFFRVHIVHTLASDLMFRVCGVPDRPIRLCGGAADYGGPRTALRGPLWVFILVRPSVGFSRSPLHGG